MFLGIKCFLPFVLKLANKKKIVVRAIFKFLIKFLSFVNPTPGLSFGGQTCDLRIDWARVSIMNIAFKIPHTFILGNTKTIKGLWAHD